MTYDQFRNAYCRLGFLERHQLVEAGVIGESDQSAWDRYQDSPAQFLIRVGGQKAKALWSLVSPNQPKEVST